MSICAVARRLDETEHVFKAPDFRKPNHSNNAIFVAAARENWVGQLQFPNEFMRSEFKRNNHIDVFL
ncbi:hypothetical protein WJ05_00505 [Burkholderia vietnamiensis]|nr:hypothetical protein WJ05_00505 [Burkholderia vietnamiensis]